MIAFVPESAPIYWRAGNYWVPIICITDSDRDANVVMEGRTDLAVIGTIDNLVLIAEKYDLGVSDEQLRNRKIRRLKR